MKTQQTKDQNLGWLARGYPRQPNKAQHSPLPWRTVVETDFEPCAICDTDGNEMVHLVGGLRSERASNAKLIVRAVNHCERLGEALRSIRNWLESGCDPSRKSLETAMMVLNEYERSKNQ